MKYDYVRTCLWKTGSLDMEELFHALEELRQQGIARLEKDGVPPQMRSFECTLEMRYIGQHWQIPVPLEMGNGHRPQVSDIVQAFHRRHEMVHGYKLEGREAEIVNIGLMAIGKSPKLQLKSSPVVGKDAGSAIKGRRKAYFGPELHFVEATLYDAARLKPGNQFTGPAIVEKPNTTVVVYPEQRATLDPYGNIIIDLL
jgi:N-methylhydantoinase A